MGEQGRKGQGSIVVICSYRPKPGKTDALLEILKDHVPTLRMLGLVTGHPRSLMTSENGTVLEIFEWESEQASRNAHDNPEVKKMWEAIGAVADFVPLSSLGEVANPFAHFEPVPNDRTNRPCHFEIHADNPERCQKFYENVFGWEFTRFGDDYLYADTGREPSQGIDGGIIKRKDPKATVCNTIQVSSIDEYCGKVEKNGGKIVVSKRKMDEMGWLAYGSDSEGNLFGMMQFK